MLKKSAMPSAWYLPMILGFYILLPLVSKALHAFDIKVLLFPALFYFIISFVYPFINYASNYIVGYATPIQLHEGFSGDYYGVYIIIGFLLRKEVLRKCRAALLTVLMIASFISSLAFTFSCYNNQVAYNIWYDSPTLLITAVCLFELCTRIKKIPCYRAVKTVSYYSFSVYLIHYPALLIICPVMSPMPVFSTLKVVILLFLSFAASMVCAWIINKIPKAGHIILYTKPDKIKA